MSELWAFVRRKGFLFNAAEIYGGFAGLYDYGTNGASLKRKFENLWLEYFLALHDNYHLLDTVNILPEACLKGSGHVDHFTDVLVECSRCVMRFRGDELIDRELGADETAAEVKRREVVCPKCGAELKVSTTNTMFPLTLGKAETAYLRPETAQGAYLNFKRQFDVCRKKLPLGLAIVGRAYRNEISPRQGVYRLREFNQAELQIFFEPGKFDEQIAFDDVKSYKIMFKPADEADVQTVECHELTTRFPKFYIYHLAMVQKFYELLNVPSDKFRFVEKSAEERAFYNKIHCDVEIDMASLAGFKEVAGVHYRTDYDLSRHQTHSNERLSVNIEGNEFMPHVLELSFGVDRNLWAFLDLFYTKGEDRAILKLVPALAPKTIGIFPLVRKDDIPEKARALHESLKRYYDCFYDAGGSIGRRYARADEIGVPYCVTVDYQTMEDDTVTVRERDSTEQERVKLDALRSYLEALLHK